MNSGNAFTVGSVQLADASTSSGTACDSVVTRSSASRHAHIRPKPTSMAARRPIRTPSAPAGRAPMTPPIAHAMKPIATLKKALPSVDVRTKEPFDAAFERSDICAVAAASIVGEAMVAITLCDALLEKFGGDSLRELVRNVEGYRQQTREF